jgi:uncharacterized lipoprotein NlpE involved in copper resistance
MRGLDYDIERLAQAVNIGVPTVKKTILAGALVVSLFVVGCNNDSATPAPATEAPAAVESVAAEVEGAVESVAAEVEAAVESVAP